MAYLLSKKTYRLLKPYILYNIITYIYWFIIGRNVGADALTTIPFWKPIIGIALGLEDWMIHCKPLWFLPCLMLTEILFYAFSKIRTNIFLFINIVILTCIGFFLSKQNLPPLPFAFGGALSMIIFYYLGYITWNKLKTTNMERIIKLKNVNIA